MSFPASLRLSVIKSDHGFFELIVTAPISSISHASPLPAFLFIYTLTVSDIKNHYKKIALVDDIDDAIRPGSYTPSAHKLAGELFAAKGIAGQTIKCAQDTELTLLIELSDAFLYGFWYFEPVQHISFSVYLRQNQVLV